MVSLKGLICSAVCIALLSSPASAYVITSFAPPSSFDRLSPVDIAALDAMTGTTGFVVEDFEDSVPVTGLVIDFAAPLVDHFMVDSGTAFGFTRWDGNRSLGNQMSSALSAIDRMIERRPLSAGPDAALSRPALVQTGPTPWL